MSKFLDYFERIGIGTDGRAIVDGRRSPCKLVATIAVVPRTTDIGLAAIGSGI